MLTNISTKLLLKKEILHTLYAFILFTQRKFHLKLKYPIKLYNIQNEPFILRIVI